MVLSQGFKQDYFELVNNLITSMLKVDTGVPPGECLVHGCHKPHNRAAPISLIMVHIYTTHLMQSWEVTQEIASRK